MRKFCRHLRSPIAIIVVMFAASGMACWTCNAQSMAEKQTGDDYLRRAFAHLEKLNTWECVAQSSKAQKYLFIADVPNNCFRFEHKSTRRMAFVKNPQGYMVFTSDSKVVTKATDPKLLELSDAKPWDVRILGLGAQSEKEAGFSVDALREGISKSKFVRFEKPDEKTVKLVYEEAMGAAPPLIREYLISLEQDFACLGTRVSYTFGGNNTELSRSSTKHELLHGLWLPVKCEHFQSDKLSETIEISWKSVNGPIDPKEFQVEGLKVPQGTYVAHQIDGKAEPVLDHIVGESKVLGDLSDVRKASDQSRSAKVNWRVLVWGAAMAITVLLLAVYVVSRNRS